MNPTSYGFYYGKWSLFVDFFVFYQWFVSGLSLFVSHLHQCQPLVEDEKGIEEKGVLLLQRKCNEKFTLLGPVISSLLKTLGIKSNGLKRM